MSYRKEGSRQRSSSSASSSSGGTRLQRALCLGQLLAQGPNVGLGLAGVLVEVVDLKGRVVLVGWVMSADRFAYQKGLVNAASNCQRRAADTSKPHLPNEVGGAALVQLLLQLLVPLRLLLLVLLLLLLCTAAAQQSW